MAIKGGSPPVMQSANRPSKGRLFHGLFLLINYQSTGQCTAADEQQRSPQNNIAGIAGLWACCIAGLRTCCIAGLQACCFAGLRTCCIAGLRACCIAGLRACCPIAGICRNDSILTQMVCLKYNITVFYRSRQGLFNLIIYNVNDFVFVIPLQIFRQSNSDLHFGIADLHNIVVSVQHIDVRNKFHILVCQFLLDLLQ